MFRWFRDLILDADEKEAKPQAFAGFVLVLLFFKIIYVASRCSLSFPVDLPA